MNRRLPGIPTSDARLLHNVSLRTSAVRVTLVAAVCALGAAALISARHLDPAKSNLLPGGTSGVVVIDMSLSITNADYSSQVRTVLGKLIDAGRPMGVVLFSDLPYELMPPRTPVKDLAPLIRFFTPVGGRLPRNPWTGSFSQGTTISTALDLAQSMLRKDHVSHGSIILFSDLETAPSDLSALGRTLSRLRRSPTTVRVVALSPSVDGLNLFQSLLGKQAFLNPVEPGSEPSKIKLSLRSKAPRTLVVLSVLLFLALAAHEGLAGRLALPREAGARSS